MSEAYWINGGQYSPGDLLDRTGVRPAQVEVLHWLSHFDEHLSGLPDIPTFLWPVHDPEDHALLQQSAMALVSGEQQLLMLAGPEEALLLASPQAVGRFNIMPRARLGAFWIHTGEGDLEAWMQTIRTRLVKMELDPNEVALLCVPGIPVQTQSTFPNALWLESQAALLSRLNLLILRLEESKANLCLLLSLPENGPWLATLVERI